MVTKAHASRNGLVPHHHAAPPPLTMGQRALRMPMLAMPELTRESSKYTVMTSTAPSW